LQYTQCIAVVLPELVKQLSDVCKKAEARSNRSHIRTVVSWSDVAHQVYDTALALLHGTRHPAANESVYHESLCIVCALFF